MDVPRVLIVQQHDAVKEDFDPNLYIADYLYTELETDGRLAPTVWAMSDPAFREAAMNGTVQHATEEPTLNQALSGAERLRARYTIWIHAVKEKGRAKGLVRLYDGRREIWKDEKTMNIEIGGKSNDVDTSLTLAHTWALMMATKPLRDLKAVPKPVTPVIAPGQQPPVISPPPAVPPKTADKVDNVALKKDLAAMVASGHRGEAIVRLRDAVDQEPLDLERRTLLVETIMVEDPREAAMEARRAANLFPDKTELRILAARAWMQAGANDEAKSDLNEAVARDPNGVPTRLLLAEIALGDGRPDQALEHVDATLKPGPNAEGLFYRALCRSLLGGTDGLSQDLADAKKIEPNPLPDTIMRRYDLFGTVYKRSMKTAVDDERSLFQRAMVKPKDPAVHDELDRLQRLAKARVALLDGLLVPVERRQSFEQRRLAASLMAQSLMDLQQFLGSGDEDSLSDARINLGEAAKHLTDAG